MSRVDPSGNGRHLLQTVDVHSISVAINIVVLVAIIVGIAVYAVHMYTRRAWRKSRKSRDDDDGFGFDFDGDGDSDVENPSVRRRKKNHARRRYGDGRSPLKSPMSAVSSDENKGPPRAEAASPSLTPTNPSPAPKQRYFDEGSDGEHSDGFSSADSADEGGEPEGVAPRRAFLTEKVANQWRPDHQRHRRPRPRQGRLKYVVGDGARQKLREAATQQTKAPP